MDDRQREQRVLDVAREGFTPDPGSHARVKRALLGAAAATTTAAVASSAAAGSSQVAGKVLAGKALAGKVLAGATVTGLGSGKVLLLAAALTVGATTVLSTALPSEPGPHPAQAPSSVRARPVLEAAPRASASPQPAPVPTPQPLPVEPTNLGQRTPDERPVPQPPPAAARPLEAREVAGDRSPPRVSRRRKSRPRTPRAARSVAGGDLQREAVLIGRARAALYDDNPEQALRSLREHGARFVHGALAQERRALQALCWCALNDVRGVRAARRFVRGAPSSPLAAHVRRGCL